MPTSPFRPDRLPGAYTKVIRRNPVRSNLTLFFLLLLVFLPFTFMTSQAGEGNRGYTIRVYGRGNTDIPTNLTKAITQDKDGMVWVGSDNGLILFNGNEFRTITDGLPSFLIKRFYHSPSFTYPLIITDRGVVEVISTDPISVRTIIPGNNVVTDSSMFYAKSIFEQKPGHYFLGEPGSVLRIANGQFTRYDFEEKYRADDFFRSFQFTSQNDSTLLVTSQRGYVFRFDERNDRFNLLPITGPYPINRIDALLTLPDGRLLVGTDSGVYELEPDETLSSVSLRLVAKLTGVSSMVLKDDMLFIGTWRNGCSIMPIGNPDGLRRLTDLPFRVITDLFAGADGTVWLSSDEGFAFIREPLFSSFELPVPTLFIQQIQPLADGSVLATEGNYVFHVTLTGDEPSFRRLYVSPSSLIMSIHGTPERFFLGYKDGFIDVIEKGKRVRTYSLLRGRESNRIIQSMDRSPGDTLVFQSVGLAGFGMILPDGSLREITSPDLSTISFAAIAFDSKRQKIILGGTTFETLLYEYDLKSGTFRSLNQWNHPMAAENMGVNTITISRNGTVLLGTSRGIVEYNGTTLSLRSGFDETLNVRSLYDDPAGGLWIGHEHGLIYQSNGENIRFDTNDGMGNITVSFRSIVKTPDSRLWVGTAAGISYFRSPEAISLTRSRTPRILNLKVNENRIAQVSGDGLTINSGSGIELSVSAFMFPTETVRYQMLVAGRDSIQRDWRTQSTFFIPNLTKGNYQIHIWARQNGFLSSDPMILTIRVLPAWYQTWWAISFLVVFLFSAFISVSYWRRNVLEKRRTESELRKSEQQNRELIEALPDFWLRLSGKLEVIDYHHGTAQLPFFTIGQLERHQSIRQLFPPSIAKPLTDCINRTRETGDSGTVIVSVDDQDGQLDFEARCLALGSREVILIFRDFSKEKQIEREIIHARETAIEVSRLKTQFLATMSHEIRTPMNAVIGMTSLLQKTVLSQEQEEYIRTLRESSDSLLRIINEILDFSKIESGKLEVDIRPFRIATATEAVLNMFYARALDKGLHLQVVYHRQTPTDVIGDESRYRQILSNLIDNAIKFTPSGGILVNIKPVVKDDHFYVEIHIRDTGIGIPPDRMDRLFNAFSQLDASVTRKYGGSGLGLAISKKLAELMDGNISVDRRQTHGSRFRVLIPTTASEETLAADIAQMTLRPVTICHPDRVIRWMLREFFRELGIQVSSYRKPTDVPPGSPLVITPAGFASQFSHPGQQVVILGPYSDQSVQGKTYSGIAGIDFLRFLFTVIEKEQKPVSEHPIRLSEMYPLSILVAEDNPVNQLLMKRLLGKLGYDIALAADGREALTVFKHSPASIIFMDVQMPVMDGLEATSLIRSDTPSGKRPVIIALTANALESDREACLNAGMDDYLSKPVTITDVERMIRKWAGSV